MENGPIEKGYISLIPAALVIGFGGGEKMSKNYIEIHGYLCFRSLKNNTQPLRW